MSFTGIPKRDAYIMRALVATIDAGQTVTVGSVSTRLPEKFDLLLSELADAKRGLELANKESVAVSENAAADTAAPATATAEPVPSTDYTSDDVRLALDEQQLARVALISAQRAKANTSGRLIAERERLAANRPPTMTRDELVKEHLATQQLRRELRAGREPVNALKMRQQYVRLPDGRMVMPALTGRRFGSTFQTQGLVNRDPSRGGIPNEAGSENGV
jgi:hypothetical protein